MVCSARVADCHHLQAVGQGPAYIHAGLRWLKKFTNSLIERSAADVDATPSETRG